MNISLENSTTTAPDKGEMAVELPEANAHSNGAHADKFEITLSVSTQTVHTKAEGGKITAFETLTIDTIDEDKVRNILTSRNYSTNVWNSSCANDNYIGMTGVILDFDGTLTIDEAREKFYGYHYILHTSASHQVKEPKGDRFRVILPFAPGPLRFVTGADCRRVYRKLLQLYPAADSACADPGRKYFPHTNELGAEFILDVNTAGRYFDIDVSDTTDTVADEFEPRDWDGVLQPKAELERVLKFCPFVGWMDKHIDDPAVHISEPLKYALISNLCWFETGRETIHSLLKRDVRPEKYDPAVVDEKIDRVRQIGPHKYATIAAFSDVNAALWGWTGDDWKGPASPAGWAKFARVQHRQPFGKAKDIHLMYDDALIVNLNGSWQVTNLDSVKNDLLPTWGKIGAICPFCDSDHAEFKADVFNFVRMTCPQCQRDYFEYPIAPSMFTYKNELLRVEQRSNEFSSMEVLEADHFRTVEEYGFTQKVLLNSRDRKFLDDNFQIRRVGSADFDCLDYEFRVSENALLFKYPALPVAVQDNAFVNLFLDTMFGVYADFIKNWMAMYSYANYINLPVIVLQGDRYTGKGTFARTVGAIFPRLQGDWDGDSNHFNEYYKNKLLFVDENPHAEKHTQYVEIKKVTGNKTIRINEKYKPEYYVPNNIKIIIATNDPKPMFVNWKEEPVADNVNNFFIYHCPKVSAESMDAELETMLQERLGHYVRTELKGRYERLVAQGFRNNRYALPAPITPFAKELFATGKSSVELESEQLAYYIVCDVDMVDPYGGTYATNIIFSGVQTEDGSRYVQLKDIQYLKKRLQYTSSPHIKAYVNSLQQMGVIDAGNHYTEKKFLGYEILWRPECYTVSGYMPPSAG